MSTEPHIDETAEAAAPGAEAVDGEEQEGPQFIEAFGKEALISIALFIAFVAFVIVCLPTYIL